MSAPEPMTVRELTARLRQMRSRLTRRDRETTDLAVLAILELTARLYDPPAPAIPKVTIARVPEPDEPAFQLPRPVDGTEDPHVET